MNTSPHPLPRHRLRASLDDPLVRVGALAAIALVVEAVLARAVLELDLDFFAQLAPLWVFVAYKLSGRHDRGTERAAAIAVVVVTTAVLLVYAM
jgi:hypothetical protein